MMHIPVLNQLESRTEWMSFFRREQPYVYVENPLCLVDFQTTHLQITLLSKKMLDGRQATKYSLGAATSMEPAWLLIKGCNWKLSEVIKGLEALDFSSNVRDNSLKKIHSDLSARKFFAKDRQIIAPTLVGSLEPVRSLPENWSPVIFCRLLRHRQFKDILFIPHPDKEVPVKKLITRMIDSYSGWEVSANNTKLILSYRGKALVSLVPNLYKPTARLQ